MVPLIDPGFINSVLTTMLIIGAIDAPYSMGIFETIVAVHFASGLAVEFDVEESDDSHIVMPAGVPKFSKTIMAIWFRVPAASLQAAYDNWVRPSPSNPLPLFNGITPIYVFGDDTVEGYKIDSDFIPTGEHHLTELWTRQDDDPVGTYELRDNLSGPNDPSTQIYEPGAAIPRPPCYIGIDSNREEIEDWDPESGDPRPTPNVLRINIQLTSTSTVSGIVPSRQTQTMGGDQIRLSVGGDPTGARSAGAISSYGPDFFGNSTFYIVGPNPFVTTSGYEDKSSVFAGSNTESFTMRLNTHEIKPDRWHLLLLSLDLSGEVIARGTQIPSRLITAEEIAALPNHGSISSTCKGWVALDDVNYKGQAIRDPDLLEEPYDRLTFDPNSLYTLNSAITATTRSPANGTTGVLAGAGFIFENVDSGFSLPTYSYEPGNVATGGHPLALPASDKYATKIHDVELGEFQMWTGQTMDTANKGNRRLFVTDKGKPVDPKVAAKALGEPTVRLHGSANWIKGKNTGTLNVQVDDLQNFTQNFDPVGRIIKYKPDPSLHGPQSPADLKKKK